MVDTSFTNLSDNTSGTTKETIFQHIKNLPTRNKWIIGITTLLTIVGIIILIIYVVNPSLLGLGSTTTVTPGTAVASSVAATLVAQGVNPNDAATTATVAGSVTQAAADSGLSLSASSNAGLQTATQVLNGGLTCAGLQSQYNIVSSTGGWGSAPVSAQQQWLMGDCDANISNPAIIPFPPAGSTCAMLVSNYNMLPNNTGSAGPYVQAEWAIGQCNTNANNLAVIPLPTCANIASTFNITASTDPAFSTLPAAIQQLWLTGTCDNNNNPMDNTNLIPLVAVPVPVATGPSTPISTNTILTTTNPTTTNPTASSFTNRRRYESFMDNRYMPGKIM